MLHVSVDAVVASDSSEPAERTLSVSGPWRGVAGGVAGGVPPLLPCIPAHHHMTGQFHPFTTGLRPPLGRHMQGPFPGMHWKDRSPPTPRPGRPAYAQPLSPWRQVPASMAFVTDSNRQ